MQLSLNQIATMCNGILTDGSNEKLIVNHVAIDSRELQQGSLFIAIIGNTNDGHNFVNQSLQNGAVGAIVNKSSGLTLPNLIIVEDTTIAIGLLAKNYRAMFDIPIVAITGSNGKTMIKEVLKIICEIEYGVDYVLASKASFNNHWGMPLSLLQLNTTHKVAILEMGMNHHGELDYLSKIAKPTIAVINNVLMSHAGFFNDLSDIAHAKGEIYNGLINNGMALINKNIPFADIWQKQLSQQNCNIIEYGTLDTACYLKECMDDGSFIIHTSKGDIHSKLKLLGTHHIYNAVTITAIALALNCSISSISKGFRQFIPYKSRMEQKLAFNSAMIIDDSYNGNPDSVKAAILAIKNLPKPHWFIFGDLVELGIFAQDEHIKLGEFIYNAGIDKLITIGELTPLTGQSYVTKTNNLNSWIHFPSNEAIVNYCRINLSKNTTLLIKGSNSMKLWQIADLLQQ